MNKSKIEWCNYTWNPVTGCLHGCEYCYAEKIAKRFKRRKEHILCTSDGATSPICFSSYENGCHDMKTPLYFTKDYGASKKSKAPYPFGFKPTFHRYRLDEPQHLKEPSVIFVCSMADLFGEWVPDSWINEVMMSITKAPQHKYIFLTKNPKRYYEYFEGAWQDIPEEYDFSKVEIYTGTSITYEKDLEKIAHLNTRKMLDFLSIEPLLEEINTEKYIYAEDDNQNYSYFKMNWVITGAETGNHKGKIIPKREWVESIVDQCRVAGVPVFMKNSLSAIWGEPLIQEFPWEVSL